MALITIFTVGVACLIAWSIKRRLRGVVWGFVVFVLAWIVGWAAGWAFGWSIIPAEEFSAGSSKEFALRIVGNTFWMAAIGAGLGLWMAKGAAAKATDNVGKRG